MLEESEGRKDIDGSHSRGSLSASKTYETVLATLRMEPKKKKKKAPQVNMGILVSDFHTFLSSSLPINPSTSSFYFPLQQVRLIPSRAHYNFKRALKMSQPNSTRSSQNPVIQQQKVIIPNNNGEKLVGILHETGSVEIVILCHGFRSSKEFYIMVNLAVALEKEGITVFRFDFSGSGESEGSFNCGRYWSEVEDLRAVIQHFSGMSRRTSAILGHSKGGQVVLLYASKYHDIPTVVNVSGPGRYDLKKAIEEHMGKDFFEQIRKDGYFDVKNKKGEVDYRVTQESLTDRLNTKIHEACLQIDKNCRVLLVHGSADDIIPVDDAVEFAKIIPNHKLHVVQGANHAYTKHQTELASVVLPFIKEGIHKGA